MKTVLVAEDNSANRELITEMLQLMGWRVIQAKDGVEVLHILADGLPDVVLLDLQMPRMDGRETIRHLRNNPEWASLRVIACTAFAMEGDREEILKEGFDGYLSKPVSLSELKRTLSRTFS